jgi:hypothetical protein
MLGHSAKTLAQGYVHIDEALRLAVRRTCEEIASLLDQTDATSEIAA